MALPSYSEPGTAHADDLRSTLRRIVRSSAAWFFAGVWVMAALYLALTGRAGFLLGPVALLLGVLLASAITVHLTGGAPATQPAPQPQQAPRTKLWLQFGLLVLVILYTAASGMAFHGNLPAWLSWLPVSTDLPMWKNGVTYFVVPLIGLLLLGAGWRELGLGAGHKAWRALAVWCALPAAAILYFMAAGAYTPLGVLKRLFNNFMYNGFFEEFLFRGAFETRLMKLFRRTDWAVVLSAMSFGVWHMGLATNNAGGDYLAGFAISFLAQGVMGLGFSILFQRTRNLLAPSLFHLIFNSVS